MHRVFLIATLICASHTPSLRAQLPATAINLAKLKISERQKPTDLCPVHLVQADPKLPTWTHKGVKYRGHTLSCQSEFEKAPQNYIEDARYQRWENNFIADMSTVWCPVTDEVAGGFLKWERLGIKWESCCRFCNATVSESQFPAALKRLEMRARQAYTETGGKYTVGARDPLEGAVRGRRSRKGSRISATELPPGQLPEGLERGLMLTITQPETSGSDTRLARLPALWVEANAPPSPLLKPGPFRATWVGFLRLDYPDELSFSAAGRGAIRLRVDGKNALIGNGEDLVDLQSEPLSLGGGFHPFELEYATPPSGAASLRLYWEGIEFPRETVPPTVLSHHLDDPSLVHGKQLRRGRELFASRLCVRCHLATDEWALTSLSMPELHTDAPSLDGIGSRLHTRWLTHWISNPRQVRPDARMPNILHHGDAAGAIKGGDMRAADIAAYLATLTDPRLENGSPAAESPTASAVAIQEGGRLFSSIGCGACHAACDSDGRSEDHPVISLNSVASKWKPRALRSFLLAPHKHHRWTRMPDFQLSPEEAGQLSAYLLEESARDELERLPPGDPASGRRLVSALGCGNCHPCSSETGHLLETTPLVDLEGLDWDLWGCLASGDGRGDAPRFAFSPAQRAALLVFGSTDLSSLRRSVPAEFAHRQFGELRCAACHGRDGSVARCPPATAPPGTPSPYSRQELLGSPTPPPLTYAGEQLRSRWLEDLLAGRVAYRVRPWLEVRMPRFPRRAPGLALGLAADHGIRPSEELTAPTRPSPETVRLGEKLFGSDGGFSCSKCHSIGARKARMEASFGVIDLLHSRQRLRDEFYLRWMMNPTRVLPMTRMPAYTDEVGESPLPGILGGNGRRQFQAIWQYVESLKTR